MLNFQQILAIVQLLIAFNVDPTTTSHVRAILEASSGVQSIPAITIPMQDTGGTAVVESTPIQVISWGFGKDKVGQYVDIITPSELATITVKDASSTEIFSGAAVLNNKYSDGNLHYINRFASSTPVNIDLKSTDGATLSLSK